jgi:hypothetical protein
MSLKQRSPQWLAVVGAGLLAMGTSALAQPATNYEPKSGQPGKDVVWVPTPQALVDQMLDMIKAHGIEYNPDMAELAKRNAVQAGVTDKATFANGDIFESDFSQATVVTLFLLPGLNVRLRPTLLDMKPGTRVVSNSFTMGDWEPDNSVTVSEDCTSFCKAYLWIIPAKAGGKWQLGQSELTIEQQYQTFTGKLVTGNVIAPITQGRLNGDRIVFTAGDTQYTGSVKGNAMEGTSKAGGAEAKWQATRQQ